MILLRLLYGALIDLEEEMLEKEDGEHKRLWEEKNRLEKELVFGLTRKQRALFHQYREQWRVLLSWELRALLYALLPRR